MKRLTIVYLLITAIFFFIVAVCGLCSRSNDED